MASAPTSSSLFTAQLHPGRGLGFMVLGASLHDILTRIKAEPQKFSQIELLYSHDDPVQEPVTVNLPGNGLRLRFDGPEQRLRLVEVIDFTLNHITFKDRDVLRPTSGGPASPSPTGESSSGPTFRHIYQRLLGPTYGGEYIPADEGDDSDEGLYVLSYPGVAFSFPLPESAFSPDKDVVALLSAPGSQTAVSMAVFSGDSWAAARDTLWTEVLPPIKVSPALPKGKDTCPDEISLVRIHGGGKIQLFRKWTTSSLWITLGETTPQQLVAELGPPNAIYNKYDQRMVIHKTRTASNTHSSRPSPSDMRPDDLTDTDQSSLQTGSEAESDEEAVDDGSDAHVAGECFYNYFHLGFDVLVSLPVAPSRPPPNADATTSPPPQAPIKSSAPDREVATKLVMHGNVPGSYEFNRHRRCRWEIGYIGESDKADSETPFSEMEEQLAQVWHPSADGTPPRQRGMVLNRGWGDSPSSSCEFLGGWEESADDRRAAAGKAKGAGGADDTTTLYGFPGLVFEVLRNGFVNTLTVF